NWWVTDKDFQEDLKKYKETPPDQHGALLDTLYNKFLTTRPKEKPAPEGGTKLSKTVQILDPGILKTPQAQTVFKKLPTDA
ncbi:hypothetical protein ABTE84_21240, partial [Acinetobacter baumannii]